MWFKAAIRLGTRFLRVAAAVVFDGERTIGHNTDVTGFGSAFDASFGPAQAQRRFLRGRLGEIGDALRGLLSEAGFMAHRVEVEVAWLVALSDAGLPELPAFSQEARARLQQLVRDFSEADAALYAAKRGGRDRVEVAA